MVPRKSFSGVPVARDVAAYQGSLLRVLGSGKLVWYTTVVYSMVPDGVRDMVPGMDTDGVHDMVSRNPNRKHVPPSRRRYEESHPTVTVRVDQELYRQLKSLRESTGQSVADVLKVGLGRVQADLRPAQEQAYSDGYEDAQNEYEVTYWCSRCQRRHLSIDTDEQKEAAAGLMYQAGWHSTACA